MQLFKCFAGMHTCSSWLTSYSNDSQKHCKGNYCSFDACHVELLQAVHVC